MINAMTLRNISIDKKINGTMDSMILAGIPIAICYWFLDSILQIFFSGQYNFIAFFFGPSLYEVYTRVTVLCLFVIFGSHAQNTINKIRHTREALNEVNENYRTVADFTYHWEYWVSETGGINYMSPSCARISGYRVDDFHKKPDLLNQIIHPDDRDRVAEHFGNESASRKTQSFEYRIITRDGRERWIDHVCQPVYGGDGQYRGKRASNSDITAIKKEIEERKKIEKKLDKNRDHLEELVKERSSELLATNAKLKGEVKERKLTQKAFEASSQFLQITFRQRRLQPLLTEFVRTIREHTGLSAAGVQLFDTIKNMPINFYNGFNQDFFDALNGLSIPSPRSMCADDRRRAVSADFQTCSRFGSRYISSASDYLIAHYNSRDRKIIQLFKNSGFETVAMIPFRVAENNHGYIYTADTRKNMINMTVLDLLESAAMQLESSVKKIQAEATLRQSHRDLEKRVKNRTKDLEVANQRLTREIAGRRHIGKERKKPASLGSFVSAVTHEINNPNNFVFFNLPILRDYINKMIPVMDRYASTEPGIEFFHMTYPDFRRDIYKLLENIEHGTGRINTFIKCLREYSQREDPRKFKTVAIKPFIKKSVSICQSEISKSIRSFKLVIADDLPKLYTDPDTLETIITNLLLNAVRASDKKDSWIQLNVSMGTAGQNPLIIEVRDNGRGLDAETMPHIFKPFFKKTSSSAGGSLGLYICHDLARILGGRIEVESKSGKGSAFRVILPFQSSQAAAGH